MRSLRIASLALVFALLGSTAHSNTPLPSQFNSDGALAFNPNGTPLAGFNADGSVNTNLPAQHQIIRTWLEPLKMAC